MRHQEELQRPVIPDLIASCWTAAGNADARGGKTPSPVDLRQRIEWAGATGWKGFGLLHADLVQAKGTIGLQTLKMLFDDNGIEHIELEYLLDWWTTGPARAASDQVRHDLFEAAGPLQARHIKIGPGIKGVPVEPEIMKKSWGELCLSAEQAGVSLALESAPYSYLPTVTSIVDLVTEVGNDSGGILLDIWHVARSGMDYETMVHEVPPEILFGVELNDAQHEIVGTLFEDTINCREYCGEGSLDVTAFIHAIDEIGFSGPWGVEIISNAHRALPVKEGLARALNTTTHCFELASSI